MFALILTFIFVLLIVVFTIQNALPVGINFLGSLFAGAIIALLIALWYKHLRKRKEENSPWNI
jgi:predicted outer membrane lipoprotein